MSHVIPAFCFALSSSTLFDLTSVSTPQHLQHKQRLLCNLLYTRLEAYKMDKDPRVPLMNLNRYATIYEKHNEHSLTSCLCQVR